MLCGCNGAVNSLKSCSLHHGGIQKEACRFSPFENALPLSTYQSIKSNELLAECENRAVPRNAGAGQCIQMSEMPVLESAFRCLRCPAHDLQRLPARAGT